MSKKKKMLVALFVLLGVAVLGLAGAVYAKYIAEITNKQGTAEVAKWAFKAENKDTEFVCELTGNYDSTKLVNGQIAPGTTGQCTFELTNTQSEVGVDYTVKVTDIAGPKNLVLKDHETGNILAVNGTVTGSLPINGSKTVTIDWEWKYYTSDADDLEDTEDGENENNMAITFMISGVQSNPSN